MGRPDRHNEIELNLVNRGWLEYLFGGQKVRVDAGRIAIFWAAIPHQIIGYAERTEYYVATIPLVWFLHCRLPGQFVQPLLRGEFSVRPCGGRAHQDWALFAGWEQDLSGTDSVAAEATLLEMKARLLRLAALPGPVGRENGRAGHELQKIDPAGLRKVEQMASVIALRYTESLRVEDVAQAVSLHPNYAMNLFHKAFGTTLVHYITQHRITHAQRLLVTTQMKVIDIAEASGFGSLSRFNDAFRHACGCSPRAYRSRVQTTHP